MTESALLAAITYLPATLVALTGLIVAVMNLVHLTHVDHAILAVETQQKVLTDAAAPQGAGASH